METQERILQKAHELFMRYGIRSISMDEIATQLGMSKKTIYQFYEDKDALVDGVVGMEITMNETECKAHRSLCENAIHEIFLAMAMVQEMLKGMKPTILFDLEKYHPKAFKKFNDHKNQFFYGVIKDNLDRGIVEEIYRAEVNTDIMARFRVGGMFLMFNPDLFPPTKMNIADVLWETAENFLYGLATIKGAKLILKYKQQRLKK
jgi:TetR/AcrR family transcriptional regulator, cholesterol catabolism regulator